MTKKISDYGTPEIRNKHNLRPELTGKGHAFRLRVTDVDEIDRLLLRKVIDLDQHETLQRLQKIIFDAGLHGVRAASLEPKITGGNASDVSDRGAEARVLLRHVVLHLEHKVDKAAAIMVVNLALDQLSARSVDGDKLIKCIEELDRFFR